MHLLKVDEGISRVKGTSPVIKNTIACHCGSTLCTLFIPKRFIVVHNGTYYSVTICSGVTLFYKVGGTGVCVCCWGGGGLMA